MRFLAAAENFFRYLGGFRRSGGFCGATGKQRSEFCDLSVNPAFCDSRPSMAAAMISDVSFLCWHVGLF